MYRNPIANISKVVGYQAKLGDKKPIGIVPNEISKAYLIRGNAKTKKFRNLNEKWSNMNVDEIKKFLGFSLGPLLPKDWPEAPIKKSKLYVESLSITESDHIK
jgi:hypothetical protein